jgi:S-adenosylmethionine hydrolase
MMKGVILSLNPDVRIVDLCHEIRPQGIRQAAFLLTASRPYFPDGVIHTVVVDPGVGSARRALGVRSEGSYFVGPDNGVLSWIPAEGSDIVEIRREDLFRKPVSSTFHGRDVFAPVAAHLSLGHPFSELGPAVEGIVQLPPPRLDIDGNTVFGEVLHVDRFGNLVTSVPEAILRGVDSSRVRVDAGSLRLVGIETTYSDRDHGQFVVYVGSAGYLEIARVGGNAGEETGSPVGGTIEVHLPPSE